MRLTKYGLPQVAVYPAVVLGLMALVGFGGPILAGAGLIWAVESVLFVVLAWMLWFFRDPQRDCPQGDDVLLSPADGVVSDVGEVHDRDGFDGPMLRIGIFLSVFDVHINRMPCAARVEKITYKKGKFKNAMDPASAKVNESNDIEIIRLAGGSAERLLVRQISGAIARRIVCAASQGQEFARGEKFGMIKFGSRTELYLPMRDGVRCIVKVGEKVRAGITILVRYEE